MFVGSESIDSGSLSSRLTSASPTPPNAQAAALALPASEITAHSDVPASVDDSEQLWEDVVSEIGVDCAVLRYLERQLQRVDELVELRVQDQAALAAIRRDQETDRANIVHLTDTV